MDHQTAQPAPAGEIIRTADTPPGALPGLDTPPPGPEALTDPHAAAVEQALAEEAPKKAMNANLFTPPKLVLGGLAYQCRPKAPGYVLASISRMAGLLAKAKGEGGLQKAIEDDPDLAVRVSLLPEELFDLAFQLVVPQHRDALVDRWRGECPDEELFDSNDLMEALVEVIPSYSGQSTPKR